MRDWAVDDVVALFTELKLTDHTAAVAEENIDGRTLQELLAADGLGELGITSKLHVLRIKHALEKADELVRTVSMVVNQKLKVEVAYLKAVEEASPTGPRWLR